ncbi:MAG: archaeosortase/exosortase family protein, partial [Deltaproteobacteria bacterium]|nr:archaeosortase/exosortase family protein [Deltaproteobacteria bacterium]
TAWFKSVIVTPYACFSALATAKLLFLLGIEFQISGSTLTLSDKSFVIAESCTGSFVFLLLAAVIIAFPASLKEKLVGLLAGFTTVVVLNLLRTLMIVVFASKFSGSFWSLHIVVGQALIIAGTLGVFIWWAQQVGQTRMLQLSRKRLFFGIFLYVLGFLFSYALYTLFLQSPLGDWFKSLVIRHAAVILGLFTETVQQGQVISTARSSIRVIHGCLSSPVLVLFLGTFFILPIPWNRRILLYLVCFFPLYYIYHVARTVTAVWFMAVGRDANFAYNFFGQVALVKAMLLFSIYYWGGIRKLVTVSQQLVRALLVIIPVVGIALLVGWFWQEVAIPYLSLFVSSNIDLYDPGRIVSLMPVFHAFSWLFLVLTTPLWSLRWRLVWGAIGCFGLSLFYVQLLAALLFLGLAPHPWLIKAINIFLPFILYILLIGRYFDFSSSPKKKEPIVGLL